MMDLKEIFIISELCGQWGGSVRRAEQMILQSKMFGADAVKVQLYDTYRMPGENRHKWEYLNMDYDTFHHLEKFAEKHDIIFFASAFHEDMYHWTLNCKFDKIASMVLGFNPELCTKIVKSGKYVLCSLGKWDGGAYPFEDKNVRYMHCVPKYPHEPEEAVELMPATFAHPLIGYSDHSIGIEACCEAIRRGAIVIEKHFTTDHNLQSSTEGAHTCSMNWEELSELRKFCDLHMSTTTTKSRELVP
jgi:sialic acid synthase SpsE